MKIKNFFLFLILSSLNLFSQNSTSSAFSFIGFGENIFKGNATNRVMGGLDVFTDSININLNNPTSYAKLKVTSYALGLNFSSKDLKKNSISEKSKTASVDYISVAIPTKFFGFGFGLIPSTSVGYRLEYSDPIAKSLSQFSGTGGINQAFFSAGFNLTRFLSFGAILNYNFGNVTNLIYDYTDGIDYGTYLQNSSDYSGFNYTIASNLDFSILKDYIIKFHLSLTPKNSISSNNKRVFYTQSVSNQVIADFRNVDLKKNGLEKINLSTFGKYDFGVGIGKKNKWSVGAQYSNLDLSGYRNEFLNYDNLYYSKGSKISLGGFYIPNFLSLTNYWSRVVYRAGVRFEKTGVKINNYNLNENSFSIGMSAPLAIYSKANLAFELGKRNIDQSSSLNETFWSIRLGLSLTDIWFVKRKYN
mgnify:CR=1 FL=1|tara:strand:+ start:90 stop:1340 length:1251 start_codon:yes stop_codon:yes gene_type:complete